MNDYLWWGLAGAVAANVLWFLIALAFMYLTRNDR